MISDRPIDQVRPLKVIYIGAGVSGIIAAIEFRKALPSVELVIYEKNPEVGGTWYENRYPGCACDIPSHAYQLSFESSTDWTQFYSGAPEILQYWKRVAEKYDVRRLVNFNHKCVEAAWDESRSKWTVKLQKTDSPESLIIDDEADILVTGTGTLNEWKWPKIEGLLDFKGTLLHTANYDEAFDPTNKSVAVVGAGSSGIQVVPAIVSKVKAMDHYVRGKTWISTQFNQDVLDLKNSQEEGQQLTNFTYSATERGAWNKDRKAYIEYRKALEYTLQSNYGITTRGSEKSVKAQALYEKNMRSRLAAKPGIISQLIPDFPPLCKRLTPGPGYLEALTDSRVSLISQPIARVYSDGIETIDGVKRPVDAIICATGFETAPESGFPIYGRDGINLRSKYHRRPKTYLGLCTDSFPNFSQSLGPNSFQGAGSLLIQMEYVHRYIAQILQKLASGNVRTIEPKRKQVDNFTNYCDEYFKQTVYTSDCVSWYKTNNKVTALWPGSSVHALHALKSVRWEDFEIEYYDDHDFGWFGNGYTTADVSATKQQAEELVWYLSDSQFLHEPRSQLHEAEKTIIESPQPSGEGSVSATIASPFHLAQEDLMSQPPSCKQSMYTERVPLSPVPSLECSTTTTEEKDLLDIPTLGDTDMAQAHHRHVATEWSYEDGTKFTDKNTHFVVLEELQQDA